MNGGKFYLELFYYFVGTFVFVKYAYVRIYLVKGFESRVTRATATNGTGPQIPP